MVVLKYRLCRVVWVISPELDDLDHPATTGTRKALAVITGVTFTTGHTQMKCARHNFLTSQFHLTTWKLTS